MHFIPAQGAVHLICGNDFQSRPVGDLVARLQRGHELLVQITGKDFGYDLQAWHDYLKSIPRAESGGYTYNRTIVLPKIMAAALASPTWKSAAKQLSGQSLAKEMRKEARGGN